MVYSTEMYCRVTEQHFKGRAIVTHTHTCTYNPQVEQVINTGMWCLEAPQGSVVQASYQWWTVQLLSQEIKTEAHSMKSAWLLSGCQ